MFLLYQTHRWNIWLEARLVGVHYGLVVEQVIAWVKTHFSFSLSAVWFLSDQWYGSERNWVVKGSVCEYKHESL